MFLSAPALSSVAAMLVAAVLPILAQTTPASQGFRGDPCEGYNGVQGTCDDVTCPPLQHDVHNLPLSEFVARHGPPCSIDLRGNKLVCCPDDLSILASKSCGQSTLGKHQGEGMADPGAWPWLAVINYNGTGRDPDECFGHSLGALVSDRYVLVQARCVAPNNKYTVGVASYTSPRSTGKQSITSSVSIRLDRWSHKYPGAPLLALMVLDTPAKLIPNKVWPVCLSKDPMVDLGYTLDDNWSDERYLGFFSYSPPSFGRKPGPAFLKQSQGFFVNCTLFCGPESRDADKLCPGSYNASYGNLNPVCLNSITTACGNPHNFLDGSPFVVESSITKKFYLVGLVSDATCREGEGDYGDMIPVNPVAKDIFAIVGK